MTDMSTNGESSNSRSRSEQMTNLKPCPFCGSEDLHIFALDDGVKCMNCGAKITGVPNWVDRWNRRVNE